MKNILKKVVAWIAVLSLLSSMIIAIPVYAGMYTEAPDTSSWFAWENPDGNLRQGTVFDASFLLDAPAGKHGFARADGEDVVFEDGTVARFWGVNLNREAVFSDNKQADEIIDRISQSGYNLVRFHQMDTASYDCIFGENTDRTISDEQLNKMFYLMAGLKEKGIYFYVDLLDSSIETQHGANGRACIFDEEIIAIQKEYATKLFTTVNPYTGLALKDDPAMVFTELLNECGLFNIGANEMSEYYINELHQKFSLWLKDKYGKTDVLKSAWEESGKSGLAEGETLEDESVTFFGDGTVHLHNLWDEQNYSAAKKADIYEFLYDTTEKYYLDMKSFLKQLGVKAMITGSAMGGYLAESASVPAMVRLNKETMDFTDCHAYMSHPSGWSMDAGTGADGRSSLYWSELHKALTARRPYNQPFVVGEWDETNMNPYRAESMPFMAGFASFQNYIPIHFTLINGRPEYNRNVRMSDPFAVWNDPVNTVLAPISAMIYLRNEVDEAELSGFDVSSKSKIISEQSSFYDYDDTFIAGKRGIVFEDLPDYSTYTGNRSEVQENLGSVINDNSMKNINEQMTFLARWTNADTAFSIDSEYTNLVVGFKKNTPWEMSGSTITTYNDFALVGMTSVTEEKLSESSSILLNAVGRAVNTGYETDSSNTIISGGTSPVLAETIDAEVILKTTDDIVVYALDQNGHRTASLPVENTDNGKKIILSGEYNALSYEITRNHGQKSINAWSDYDNQCFWVSGIMDAYANKQITVSVSNSDIGVNYSGSTTVSSVGSFCLSIPTGQAINGGSYLVDVYCEEELISQMNIECPEMYKTKITAELKAKEDGLEISGTAFLGNASLTDADISIIAVTPDYPYDSSEELDNSANYRYIYALKQVKTDGYGRYTYQVSFDGANYGYYKFFVHSDAAVDGNNVSSPILKCGYLYSEDIKVVYVGDKDFRGDYLTTLSDMLGDGYALTDCGVEKATMLQSRTGYIGSKAYTVSHRAASDTVIINIGGWDIKNEIDFSDEDNCNSYRENCVRLIERYRQLNRASRIILTTPVFNENESDLSLASNEYLIPLLKNIAEENNCDFVDTGSILSENGSDTAVAESLYDVIVSPKDFKRISADFLDLSQKRLSLISPYDLKTNIYIGAYNSDKRLLASRYCENIFLYALKSTVLDMTDISFPEGTEFIRVFYWDNKLVPLAEAEIAGNRAVQLDNMWKITGRSLMGKNRMHTIFVTDEYGNPVFADQKYTDDSGEYEYLIPFSNENYILYTATEKKPVSETIGVE